VAGVARGWKRRLDGNGGIIIWRRKVGGGDVVALSGAGQDNARQYEMCVCAGRSMLGRGNSI
jgi:hypothetical protein